MAMKGKSLCFWESICIKCKQIYAIRIAIKNGDTIDKHQSYGICPDCLKKRKEEKIKQAEEEEANELEVSNLLRIKN